MNGPRSSKPDLPAPEESGGNHGSTKKRDAVQYDESNVRINRVASPYPFLQYAPYPILQYGELNVRINRAASPFPFSASPFPFSVGLEKSIARGISTSVDEKAPRQRSCLGARRRFNYSNKASSAAAYPSPRCNE